MTVRCQDCGHTNETMSILPTPPVTVRKMRGIASIDGRMTCRKCKSENLVEHREK